MCERVPGADEFVRQRCVQKGAPREDKTVDGKTLSQGNLSKLQKDLGNPSPLPKDPDTLAETNDTPKRKIDTVEEDERPEPKRRTARKPMLACKANRRGGRIGGYGHVLFRSVIIYERFRS